MSRASDGANSVVAAVEQVAALYHTPCFRMQSRALRMPGRGGKDHLYFTGQWRDADGVLHRAGMYDLLLLPNITTLAKTKIRVALWVECKFGTGAVSPDQQAFDYYMRQNSVAAIVARDSADRVLQWFHEHGVTRW